MLDGLDVTRVERMRERTANRVAEHDELVLFVVIPRGFVVRLAAGVEQSVARWEHGSERGVAVFANGITFVLREAFFFASG